MSRTSETQGGDQEAARNELVRSLGELATQGWTPVDGILPLFAIKDVPARTRQIVKIYAAQTGLNMGEALTRMIDYFAGIPDEAATDAGQPGADAGSEPGQS